MVVVGDLKDNQNMSQFFTNHAKVKDGNQMYSRKGAFYFYFFLFIYMYLFLFYFILFIYFFSSMNVNTFIG